MNLRRSFSSLGKGPCPIDHFFLSPKPQGARGISTFHHSLMRVGFSKICVLTAILYNLKYLGISLNVFSCHLIWHFILCMNVMYKCPTKPMYFARNVPFNFWLNSVTNIQGVWKKCIPQLQTINSVFSMHVNKGFLVGC